MTTLSNRISLFIDSPDGLLGILMSALAGIAAAQDAYTIRYRVF
jgi:hypothetical protein